MVKLGLCEGWHCLSGSKPKKMIAFAARNSILYRTKLSVPILRIEVPGQVLMLNEREDELWELPWIVIYFFATRFLCVRYVEVCATPAIRKETSCSCQRYLPDMALWALFLLPDQGASPGLAPASSTPSPFGGSNLMTNKEQPLEPGMRAPSTSTGDLSAATAGLRSASGSESPTGEFPPPVGGARSGLTNQDNLSQLGSPHVQSKASRILCVFILHWYSIIF